MSEPIRILRVITEEVTSPRMDGTPGSGLYQVPFELSSLPPAGWGAAFVEAWNHPQSWSSMHRPGIASVSGRKILLNGTTLDEVQETHKPTLISAVESANSWVVKAQLNAAKREAVAEEREAAYRKQLMEKAAKITFD